MTDSSGNLIGRLRRALAPGLEVEAELGSGGMGVVYAGRDPVLDRPVAIKILRPEAATAVAAERFLREGRLLARLDHPNIVRVHQAGQADGLFYLVMDRLEGQRLDDRLRAGPLPPTEVTELGGQLLDALAAIHAAGVIHRDIKPSNILTRGNRPMLVDFGIASASDRSIELTMPGAPIGTPAYMAPEQALGLPASIATDIWALGATLYEAATGHRYDPGGGADWASVPSRLAKAIGRALQMEPTERWPSAAEFHRALVDAPSRRRTLLALATVAVLAAVAAIWWPDPAPAPPARRRLALAPIVAVGPAAERLEDSVAQALTARLRGYPDFELAPDHGDRGNGLRLESRLVDFAGGLRFEMTIWEAGRSIASQSPTVADPRAWARLVDSASDGIALAVLAGPLKSDPWVPSGALPESPAALRRLLDAERHFASGHWQKALTAYLEAERADSSCLLCSYRLQDVNRWLNRGLDPARTERLLGAAGQFPPHYRMLIQAEALPIGERLDSLEAATRRYRDFDLVWYRHGEELFHRGPWVGRLSGESAESFRATLRLRPEFAPAWNHLAWVSIVDRDSAGAARALGEYQRLEASSSGVPYVQLGLLLVAQAWRFGNGASGPAVTEAVLGDPRLTDQRLLGAGPRLLLALRAWEGAVWLGHRLARLGDAELARAGLMAEALGRMAEGRLDSMAMVARRLEESAPDEATRMFANGLPATAALAEGDSIPPAAVGPLVDPLRRYLEPGATQPAVRRGAAVLVGAVAIAAARSDIRARAERALGGDEHGAGHLRLLALLAAHRSGAASAAPYDSVLANSPWILEEQPAARAVLVLSQARWQARRGSAGAAVRTLRFVDHQHVADLPIGAPLATEIEWALGPIARWTEASILERAGQDRSRRCRLYGELATDWRLGEPPYADRARQAEVAWRRLGCGTRS